MFKLESTTDCIYAAEQLKKEAAEVTNEREHAAWWDRKVEVLNVINRAFETGFFRTEAYDELWMAKHILGEAELIAGTYSIK